MLLSLSYFKGFKKFVLNAEVAYSYNKDAIVPGSSIRRYEYH